MRTLLTGTAALLAVLVAAGPAEAGRYAVGLEAGASVEAVEARIAGSGAKIVSRELRPLGALTVRAADATSLRRLRGVSYVERLDAPRRLAFTPNDPLFDRQWYLPQNRAFDAWAVQPPLAAVRVAIIDSGADAGHPELGEDRIVAGKSFVGDDWRVDSQGHGTFVAGLIAARTNDGEGIAGMAFGAELLVAKVVAEDRTIPLEAEARAIRWAIAEGARVINLSLGGLRDPFNPSRDTYSPLEAAAVAYAVRHGAVVVAAVGNGDQAPRQPWPYASYPAALPHVLGVSALAQDGSIPDFSDRDPIFNDIAAPGQGIFSTIPRALTAAQPACKLQGYSECGPEDYQRGEGTSFAAPQVTAAAALVLGVAPDLRPDQVTHILTREADDVTAATGCKTCAAGRDALSGWGRLDVAKAVTNATSVPPPEADQRETNDNAGELAPKAYGRRRNTIRATIDFWDDETDVYRVYVRAQQRLGVSLSGPPGTRLYLWKPGTTRVSSIDFARRRVAQSVQRGSVQRLVYRPALRHGGWYYLQVRSTRGGAGPYVLNYTKR